MGEYTLQNDNSNKEFDVQMNKIKKTAPAPEGLPKEEDINI